jgi:phage/plasmid-like protein (TIGR03299 family)
MAHEITSTDQVVLHREKAWHGLGIVVQDAPTPTEALHIAHLDWTVEQWPLVAVNEGGARMAVPSHFLNVRSDTQSHLGVVGKGYRPVQNIELAEFAEALAKQGDVVRCESAGSIRGGQKVWFLLKGQSFSVRHKDDEVIPYICISNGHDGTAAVRATPTTVRVVCSNTLHMVIPQDDRRTVRTSGGAFVIQHSGDIKAKVAEAQEALRIYEHAAKNTEALIGTLAHKNVTAEQVQAFWLDVYQRQFGAVSATPATDKQTKHREAALEAIGTMGNNFDRDRKLTGATAWGALNAYTHWVQHDRQIRGKDEDAREERRVHENLFGANAERSGIAFQAALEMA